MITMADGEAFNWPASWTLKDQASGQWLRTFTIITTEANELVAKLHDRTDHVPDVHDQ